MRSFSLDRMSRRGATDPRSTCRSQSPASGSQQLPLCHSGLGPAGHSRFQDGKSSAGGPPSAAEEAKIRL
jgi:hypothetical protein